MTSNRIRDGGHSLSIHGPIDGSFDLCDILTSPRQAIAFQHVTGINSLGAKNFIDFVGQWNGRKFTYWGCPVVMMDAFVFIPLLLGPPENTATIMTFHAPYECLNCDVEVAVLLNSATLVKGPRGIIFPAGTVCQNCHGSVTLQESAENYTSIVACGALKLRAA